ncbi:hypothetical protein M9Y56_05530 [Pseudomonas juntendi]|nr:hypothetical protein [Pseudomonas juntendi]MCL8328580.1 hypothetical protein [Pseudomonas juntendi]
MHSHNHYKRQCNGKLNQGRKADSSVDAWAILCLIVLVVVTAVYWVSHQ